MQAERLIRRAEGKKRRAIETKIKEDAILKRRAAEVQKTTRQKANATARSAIPLGKIDEADNSEDDLETHGSYPKPPDYETAYRSPVTFQQSETSDAIASGTDDEITRKLGVASAMLALKLRDLPIASDTNQKDVLVGSSCPPPKPPKPVKPPRHGNLTASAPALETTSGPGFQLPASSRDATGADVSSMVTRPTAPPPPLSAPKASETEMEPQPAPRPLRPKSVKFSMIFSDITEDIFYKMPTVSQSIKSEDVARHVVPNGDPLNMSDRDLYSITDRDADTVTSSRPISRRLRPPSVNLRRQRSRLSLNTLEGQRNDFIDTSAPPSLLPSPSCPHYSDASASLRRGLSTMDRAEGASSTDGGPNSLRNGMEMPGGSAVSAILARRKHLEDDSDGSDTDRDSDSDWE